MQVLHIETGRHLYGGSLQVHYLINGLKKAGVENVLVCEQSSPLAEKVGSDASRIYREKISGDLDLSFIGRLKVIFKHEQPDLIHLHSRRGCEWLGGIAAKQLGIPVVLSRRVDNPEPKVLAAIKYRLYDHIVTISQGILNVLASEGVPQNKLSCVPSAVNIEQYQKAINKQWFEQEFGFEPHSYVIGVVAQLIPRKGHRYLLDVLPGLLKTFPNIKVLFLGQGPEKESLLQKVNDLNLTETVQFAGFRNDLETVLPNLDLLVHPAEMEGLGVSLLQAAVAGVPIIATNAGGMPEIVRHGRTGLLVEPKITEQLRDAIETMLTEPHTAKQMVEEAKKLVEEAFSIPAMVQGNLAVYQRVLAI